MQEIYCSVDSMISKAPMGLQILVLSCYLLFVVEWKFLRKRAEKDGGRGYFIEIPVLNDIPVIIYCSCF